VRRVQIKVEYSQLHEMAPAFGVRALGTALVVHIDTLAMLERKPTAFLVSEVYRIRRCLPKRSQAPALQRLRRSDLCTRFRVLDFGMDLTKSIDTPNFMGPFFGLPVLQLYMELLAEGEFDANLVKAVIAKGQAIKLLPKDQTRGQCGYWVAIQIDPKTGKRIGVTTTLLNGEVASN